MSASAPLPAAVVTPSPAAVLHLGFSDPKSALRLPLAVPYSLRVALAARLAARGGTVLETAQGFSSFHAGAASAVQAAVEILATGTTLLVDDTAPIALRAVLVGMAGEGDGARAAALSRAVQLLPLSRDHTLLVTRDIYEVIDRPLHERARLAASPLIVEQHPELADLFELDWKSAALKLPEVTLKPEPIETAAATERLELSHGGTRLQLLARDCPLTLGRDKTCGVHLDGDVASRVHGRIEFLHDKFYYVDDSRNGTYLLTPQGEEIFLHHERLPLLGRGVISPGAPIVKQTGEVVRYSCRSDEPAETLMPPLSADRPSAEHHATH